MRLAPSSRSWGGKVVTTGASTYAITWTKGTVWISRAAMAGASRPRRGAAAHRQQPLLHNRRCFARAQRGGLTRSRACSPAASDARRTGAAFSAAERPPSGPAMPHLEFQYLTVRCRSQAGKPRSNARPRESSAASPSTSANEGSAYGSSNRRIVVSIRHRAYKLTGRVCNKPYDGRCRRTIRTPSRRSNFAALLAENREDGTVYVCDRGNNRIQLFDNGHSSKMAVAKTTGGDGSVWDLAFSSDAQQRWVFVADGQNKKVRILQRDTLAEVSTFGQGGRWPGTFYGLGSVAVDSKGNIYTGENLEGKRVQKFVRGSAMRRREESVIGDSRRACRGIALLAAGERRSSAPCGEAKSTVTAWAVRVDSAVPKRCPTIGHRLTSASPSTPTISGDRPSTGPGTDAASWRRDKNGECCAKAPPILECDQQATCCGMWRIPGEGTWPFEPRPLNRSQARVDGSNAPATATS